MPTHSNGKPSLQTTTCHQPPPISIRSGLSSSGTAVLTTPYRVGKSEWAKKACEECHRRKIKCNMTSKNSCTSCTKLNVSCSVNEYRRRRNKERRSKIDQLESQVDRMEQVFEQLGLMIPPRNDQSGPATPDVQMQDTVHSTWDGISRSELGDHLIDHGENSVSTPAIPTLMGNDNSFLQNLAFPHNTECGSNDGRNICSDFHRCRQDWIRVALGENYIEEKRSKEIVSLPSQIPYHDGEPHLLDGSITPRGTLYHLPTMAEIMVLFLEYLEKFNAICPLFEPLSLLSVCDGEYDSPSILPDRWACVNVVLALAYIMRDDPHDCTHKNSETAWRFMENALLVMDELCFGKETLWAAQALLGMAIVFLGSLSYQPCNQIVTSALRISHRLAIERLEHSSPDGKRDLHQCRTVFWIAFCLDKEICLRFGGSPESCDEDMDIAFPPGPSGDGWILSSTTQKTGFNIFQSYCELSLIKGQIYKHLYCVTTTDQSVSELADSVAMLDKRLQKWKESVPKEYRPDVENTPLLTKSNVGLLSLHFSYFNCLISVHRMATLRDSSINLKLARSYTSGLLPSDIALISGVLCQNAARASIQLMKYMPQRCATIVGFFLHYLITASITLSTSITCNPPLVSQAWDMKLIDQVQCFMSSIALASKEKLTRLVKYCAEYRASAESAIRQREAALNDVHNPNLT